jgi:hypothetical protein
MNMVKYVKTGKTPKPEWQATQEIAELEAIGTPEALERAARLRWLEVALYRMGRYGRWIAKQDAESQSED